MTGFVSSSTPWQSNLLRREPVASDGATRTNWTEFRRFGSRELRVDVTVTEWSRPNRITYVGDSLGIHARGELEFYPEGSRTRIVHRVQMRGRGLSTVLAPLVAPRLRAILQADLFRITLRFAQIAA